MNKEDDKCHYQDKVLEFTKAFLCFENENAELPTDNNLRAVRIKLLKEEFEEYLDGEENNDLVEIADALGDMLYIIFGTAISYGLNLKPIFNEIHRSNMTKLDDNGKPIFREDGKVLKSKNYEPPNIHKVIMENLVKKGES